MIACSWYPCAGTIDEMGFCDRCDRKPRETAPGGQALAPGRAGAPVVVPRRTGATRDIEGFLSLPVLEFPDPSSRVIDVPEVPEAHRWCSACGAPVGRGYAGQPPLIEGYCWFDGARFSFAPPDLRKGDLVDGRYLIVGCLARGGIGYVYLAKDRPLGDRYVVLKWQINAASKEALALVLAELEHLLAVDHSHIVRVSNFVRQPGPTSVEQTAYIVMEFLDGIPLSQLGPAVQELEFEHLLVYGLEILAAMDYLHGRGLLYCDMKPANVIRCADRVKLVDLGGGRAINDHEKPVIGTEGFQVSEDEIERFGLTIESDIHTVGVTLRRLYELNQDVGDDPPTGGHEAFERLVDRAADPDRSSRFGSAAEMAEQLRGVACEFIASRDRKEHPRRSKMFAATAELLDGGLGSVPPLDHWVTGTDERPLDLGRPPAGMAAVRLPTPRVAPDDPAARFLDVAPSPASVIEKVPFQPDSIEMQFAGCRAELELSWLQDAAVRIDDAGGRLRAAEALLGDRAQYDWRVAWHSGLLALAGGDPGSAGADFDRVYRALPGEPAPKLAIAVCAELVAFDEADQSSAHEESADEESADEKAERQRQAECLRAECLRRAEHYYRVVWWRDRSLASAAFGLARIRLAQNDRAGAVEILTEVPRVSRHYDTAQIAAIRVLSGRLPSGLPSETDLRQAMRRLSNLRLDGGQDLGEVRQRLETSVREIALRRVLDTGQPALPEGSLLLGHPSDERRLRMLLERSYRTLALRARDADEHGALVDRANAIRPRTLR